MKIAFINGIILDGSENMEPQEGKMILTNGESISEITSFNKDRLKGYQIVDLKGKYIMPGLINLHVHIPATGKPKKKPLDAKKLVRTMTSNGLMRKILQIMYEKYVRIQLMSGVTTIRSVGGVENYDSRTRDKINSGKAVGPRILAGNKAISVPGGHMAGSLAYEATTMQEAVTFVRKIAQDKPDLIKLMITGGVLDAAERGEPGMLKMSPDIVKAACDEAHNLGLKVAAHTESPEGVIVALENGVDTIEHGAKPDEHMLSLFKEKDAALVATISPALPYALFNLDVSKCGEIAQYNGKIVFDGIVECAKQCLDSGIPVGLGTDTGCPFVTHYDMWRELNYFHKYCGVSNAFALHTATKRNAEIVGLGNVTGSIEEGKCADFVVTENNPLENIEALRNIDMVVIRGKLIRNPKVKKMKKVETELDKFI